MRKMQAEEFGNSWEYDRAKRKERKQDRQSRTRRKAGRSIWEARPADE